MNLARLIARDQYDASPRDSNAALFWELVKIALDPTRRAAELLRSLEEIAA